MGRQIKPVFEFANNLCEHLPEGWTVSLRMEQGFGGIELFNPEGYEIKFEDFSSVDHDIEQQANAALRYAQGEREAD